MTLAKEHNTKTYAFIFIYIFMGNFKADDFVHFTYNTGMKSVLHNI